MRTPGPALSLACGLVVVLLVHPLAAQSPSESLAVGHVFRDCPTCPEVVVVPAGSFIMGSTPEETTRAGLPAEQAAREWPAHHVTIAKPFAVGRYELTVGEYAAFAKDTARPAGNNCTTWDSAAKKWGPVADASWQNPGYPQTDRHPVGCLTLDDVRGYTQWLSQKTGQRYRVPSEAEWEYIARAGRNSDVAAENICTSANVSDLMRAQAHGGDAADATRFFKCRDGHVFAAPVGAFPANPWGLSDVIGNIWEWTEDCFIPGYDGAPTDGSAHMPAGCERLIVRGGGWYSRSWFARAAGRSRETPDYRSSTLGLRVVRDLP
jgi:formylglycine-generating enzyme